MDVLESSTNVMFPIEISFVKKHNPEALIVCIADLDHTADVQLHCWGKNLSEAFAHMVPCMFNYMTDLSTVTIKAEKVIEFTVKGERNFHAPIYFKLQNLIRAKLYSLIWSFEYFSYSS